MTLLVNFYTSKGIVFAADRAITVRTPRGLERWEKGSKQRKIHKVAQLGLTGGVIGFFGLAIVGTEPMDTWLRRTLNAWPGSRTVAELGVYLRDELNRCVDPGQRETNASGFHIGAFESRSGAPMPVMQYVSNINQLTDGRYSDFRAYVTDEHFPQHPSGPEAPPHAPAELREILRVYAKEHAMPMWFRNGDLPFAARTWEGVEAAVRSIISTEPGFTVPDTLEHWGALARAVLRLAADLYPVLVSNGAPSIEGPFDVVHIPWP
jgi:hypothetical protein